jgi:hypothetical protein
MFTSQRLLQLDTNLNILYEKLGALEKEYHMAFDAGYKISLTQRMREQKAEILQCKEEYFQLLAQQAKSLVADDIDESYANSICAEIVTVADELIEHNNNRELINLLKQIKDKINEPEKPAAAKLKAAIPLLPGFLSYEAEVDTEGVLKRIFTTFHKLFEAIPKKK